MELRDVDEGGPAPARQAATPQGKGFAKSNSYLDPAYSQFELEAAEKVGIEPSLIRGARIYGEKTNRDVTSNKGARSVYQIIPETRAALKKKYGVDAYASDKEASLATAYLLKENLDRNKGNVEQAIGEYHGGTDRSQWGPVNKAYRKRVLGGLGLSVGELTDVDEVPKTGFQTYGAGKVATDLGSQELQYRGKGRAPIRIGGIDIGDFGPTARMMIERAAKAPGRAVLGLADLFRGITEAPMAALPGPTGELFRKKAARDVAARKGIEERFGLGEPEPVTTKAGEIPALPRQLGVLAEFLGMAPFGAAGAMTKGVGAGKALTTGVVGATGGAASSIAGEVFGKHTARALGGDEEKGALVGSILVPGVTGLLGTVAANKVFKSVDTGLSKMKISGLSPAAQKQAAESLLSEELQKAIAADPKAMGRTAEAAALQKKFPGLKFTIERASGAPGLISEKERIMGTTPEAISRGAAESERNLAAIQAGQEAMFPAGKTKFTQPARIQRQAALKELDAKTAELENRARVLAQRTPVGKQQAIGGELKDIRDRLSVAGKEKTAALFAEAKDAAAAQNIRPDTTSTVSSLKELLGDKYRIAQDKPTIIGRIIKKFDPAQEKLPPAKTVEEVIRRRQLEQAPKTADFGEFYSFHKEVGKEAAAARRAGNLEEAGILDKLYGTMQNEINRFDSPAYGDFYKKFSGYKAYYRDTYAPKFKEGVGGKMTRTNRFGEITPDEQVVSNLILNPTGMDEALRMVGNDPAGIAAISKGVIDKFARDVGVPETGVVNPKLAKKWISDNAEILGKIPEVKRNLTDTSTTTEMILRRRQQLVKERKALDNDVLAKVLRSEDPAAEVGQRLKNPSELRSLFESVKSDAEASKSLARTVASKISEMPNPGKYLAENGAVLKPMLDQLGKTHFQNLKAITRAGEIEKRVTVPTHVRAPGTQDIGEELLGTKLPSIWSRLTNPRISSAGWNMLDIGNRFVFKVRGEHMEKLKEAMLFNPDVTEVLAQIQKTGATKAKADTLRAHLLAHGIRVGGVAAGKQGFREKEE